MPITTADLKWYYSINQGPGAGAAQANPNDSLGGFMSSTEWAGGTLHDLFDIVSGDENVAAESEYRCVFVRNTHATLTLQNAKVWMVSEGAGGAIAAIALDGTGVIAATSASAQAERVANENTAPAGESFSTPTTKAGGLVIGNLAPGQCVALWLRRTTANTGALNNDNAVPRIEGDTAA